MNLNPNETSDLSTDVHEAPSEIQQAGSSPLAGAGEEFSTEPGIDPLAGAVAARKGNGGVILIIAVVLVATAGLFSMRKVAQITAEKVVSRPEIEQTVETFLKSIGTALEPDDPDQPPVQAPTNSTLAVLTETYSEHQIPLQDVQRNPFVINEVEVKDTIPVRPVIDPDEAARRRQRELEESWRGRHKALTDAAGKLRLKSIMGGSRPMALIGDTIMMVGDTIPAKNESDDVFRIAAIGASSVDLVAEVTDMDLTVAVTLQIER